MRFAREFLRIRPEVLHRGHFVALGLTDGESPREEIEMRALWTFVAYKAHNLLRTQPTATHIDHFDLLKQFARQGVMGHPQASATLDSRWTRSATGDSVGNLVDANDTCEEDVDMS